MLCLLFFKGQPVPCAKIAEVADTPEEFTYKILQKLVDAEIVESDAGRAGGFKLARAPEDISLKEIVEAIQGPVEVSKCVLSPQACGRREECPLSGEWARLQAGISSFLGQKSLYGISQLFVFPEDPENAGKDNPPHLEEESGV